MPKLKTYFDEAHEIIGWIGTFLILTAYILLSFDFIEGTSIGYQVLNLLGAMAIVYNTQKQKAFPAMILNVIWAGIAILSILMAYI